MRRETARIHGIALVIEALGHAQRADFCEVEVADVVAAVFAGPVGIACGYIRYPIEVDVMQHHEFVVSRRDDVLFEEIRPHRVGHGLGWQGVFRQVAAGTPVCDHGGHQISNFNKPL